MLPEPLTLGAADPIDLHLHTHASDDGGAHWRPIAEGLPRIQSVEVALVS